MPGKSDEGVEEETSHKVTFGCYDIVGDRNEIRRCEPQAAAPRDVVIVSFAASDSILGVLGVSVCVMARG